MAGGLLTSCSVLERYQYACGIVGKNPEGTWAACYKAALTHQSVRGGAGQRSWSWSCTEHQKDEEDPGLYRAMLALPLARPA